METNKISDSLVLIKKCRKCNLLDKSVYDCFANNERSSKSIEAYAIIKMNNEAYRKNYFAARETYFIIFSNIQI